MEEKKIVENNKKEDSMMTNAVTKVNNTLFNEFLKLNKAKIKSVIPGNPSLSVNDEWRKEDFWTDDNGEKDSK